MATQVTQPVEPEVKENQPEVDPETGKFIYTYQPRDSEGQFIGKPYRFFYTDHQDLVRQITEAKENADRFIHEVKSGKRKLQGEPATPVPTYQPAPESTEEDERKRREEFRKTVEQEFGAPVDQVRSDMERARKLEEFLICNTWAMNNPDYYACAKNAFAIDKWLKDQKPPLKVNAENLNLAFEELRDSLVQAPKEPIPEAPADSTQQQPPTRTEVRPQSTGIIPGQFAGTRQPNRTDKSPMSVDRFRQIDRMSYPVFQMLKRDNPTEYWNFVRMKETSKAQPQQ